MKRYRIVDGLGVVSDYHVSYAAALAVRDRLEADGYACGHVVEVKANGHVVEVKANGLARVHRRKKK